MKGMVFVGLIDWCDELLGAVDTELMLQRLNLPSGAAYTQVGSYNSEEFKTLFQTLARTTGRDPADLIQSFGKYLFAALAAGHQHFLLDYKDLLSMLEAIESIIHPEVLKLYPEAELPSFQTERLDECHLRMTYHSMRGLPHLAAGLIEGAAKYYKESVKVQIELLDEGATSAILDIRTEH